MKETMIYLFGLLLLQTGCSNNKTQLDTGGSGSSKSNLEFSDDRLLNAVREFQSENPASIIFDLFVIRFHVDGIHVLLATKSSKQSSVFEYPSAGYVVVDGKVIFIYTGVEKLFILDPYYFQREDIYQNLGLEDDWDEKNKEKKGKSGGIFHERRKLLIISTDSISSQSNPPVWLHPYVSEPKGTILFEH